MAVAITTLSKALITKGTGIGPTAQVSTHMILHVAQFGEGLLAHGALQVLVHPPSHLVDVLLLFEEPSYFGDLAVGSLFQVHNLAILFTGSALLEPLLIAFVSCAFIPHHALTLALGVILLAHQS